MMRFTFKKGLVFLEATNRWQLQRRLVNGRLQFESESGEIKTLSDQEVHKLWLIGQWMLDPQSLGSHADVIYLAAPRDLRTFPEKWQKEATRRLHYIQKIEPHKQKYNLELWRSLIQSAGEEIKDTGPPSPSTLHAWWKRYRDSQSITSLIPRSLASKNFVRPPVYAIFEEVISKVYLSHQKKPKSDVVAEMQSHISLLNLIRDATHYFKPIFFTLGRFFTLIKLS